MRAETDAGRGGVSLRSLPPELAEQSRVRLSWLAGAAGIGIVSFALLARILQPEVARAQKILLVRVDLVAGVLISLAMIALERSRSLRATSILRVGLAYQVLVAAAIAVVENAMPWEAGDIVRGASSITVWLVAFALLVPAPPVPAALFSVAAAATGPLIHYLVSTPLGLPVAPANRLLIYYGPCFLAALVAALMNLRILKLEAAAARAREMGSYELDSLLARGGMGEVWRARHRLLKREAAVKLIRREMLQAQTGRDADALLKRFEQEARATASLRSPHTVALYDFGMTEDGGLYYAMELLDGIDLDSLVKQFGPQPAGRVVHILRQACISLEEAHRRGMVHRDIKPTNLFLCRLGTVYDFCKLLDFGLVKHLVSSAGAGVTREGAAAGTPAFMAPEVATASKELDGRADIYGLGCVAYWLLTGQLVFEEQTQLATALAHVRKQPVPPSQRTELEVPAALEEIVMACLAKNPDERPARAAELGRMLAACTAVPAWGPEDAERWWQMHLPAAGEPTLDFAGAADV